MLFFCLFCDGGCKFRKIFQHDKTGQRNAAYAVERVEIVNYVVKAEEAQRIGDHKTAEHRKGLVFVLAKRTRKGEF